MLLKIFILPVGHIIGLNVLYLIGYFYGGRHPSTDLITLHLVYIGTILGVIIFALSIGVCMVRREPAGERAPQLDLILPSLIMLVCYILVFDLYDNFWNIRSQLTNRQSKGWLYLATLNLFILSYYFDVWSNRMSAMRWIFYIGFAYLFASKAIMPLMFILYLTINLRSFSALGYLVRLIVPVFFLILAFFIYSGVPLADLPEYILTYFDHLLRTEEALMMLAPGELPSMLDGFWAYLPREVFPEKPYVYGDLHLIEAIAPGALERGYAPALVDWAYSYFSGGIFLFMFWTLGYALLIIFSALLFFKRQNLVNFALYFHMASGGFFVYPSRAIGFLFAFLVTIYFIQRVVPTNREFPLSK